MKYMLISMLSGMVLLASSCSSDGAMTKIQEQIDGQKIAFSDTISHFTSQISSLEMKLDSLNLVAEAQAAAKAVRSGGGTKTTTTTTTTPPKDPGKIDVGVKGGDKGAGGKIDVGVKGGGTEGGSRGGKIDVSKKGGGK